MEQQNLFTVPKIIHQIWLGELTPTARYFINTWKEHNPTFRHILWTEKTLPPCQNEHILKRVQGNSVIKDIYRYELLATYGGYYFDCDILCLRSIEDLNFPFVSFEKTVPGKTSARISNATLAAERNNPFFLHLIKVISGITRFPVFPIRDTGPFLLKRELANFPDFKILPYWTFHPVAWYDQTEPPEFSRSYGIHFFDSRKDETSQQLKRKYMK